MTEDAKEIENLFSKLHSGTTDDKFEALMGLAIKSKSSIDEHLKEQMRTNLVPIVTGQVQTDLQSCCFAAIALAHLGDHSEDIAAPLLTYLQYLAEDPSAFSGPMDEFLSSDNLLAFPVQIIYALKTFKGDRKVVGLLIDVLARCMDPKNGEKRVKSLSDLSGGQFYDARVGNLVTNCLRCIGVIGETEDNEGKKMLEWWSSRGNVTSEAALEMFGSSWDDIRNKERQLEKSEAVNAEPKTEKENDDKTSALLAKVLNLCESDPDAGLELIEVSTKGKPEAESNPVWKWAKAMAYGGKGLLQALRELRLSDEELAEVSTWGGGEFRERLRLTDEHLDYLEVALREVREIEIVEPRFVAMIGTEEERVGEAKVDLIAIALERCRPGKVQKLMGTTKLLYFGSEHRRMGVRPGLDLTSKDDAILWNTRFSAPLVVKAAIAMDRGVDGKGRSFVTCLLYQKCLDEWGPDETLATASSAGILYLFDDGSWHHSNDTEMAFRGAVMPGLSLPPEFRQSPKTETGLPKTIQPDSTEVPSEQEFKPDTTKKRGFFKKLLG